MRSVSPWAYRTPGDEVNVGERTFDIHTLVKAIASQFSSILAYYFM
ncbi:MAG: hypothetical protein KME49_31415 [Brasilonema octagenarum HA4186-MV1]|jgi:hypothetical protein|nr:MULTISPECIES: hypothetical protein [Brasilonema]MBW4629899.1 hypothetical protein [Brasilonema octagenarum HA4186-MV1]